MSRKRLDPALIASYMDRAYVTNGRFGPSAGEAREVVKRRYYDAAWKELQEAGTFEQQRDAVMKLSDMVFGDDEVGKHVVRYALLANPGQRQHHPTSSWAH